MSLNPYSPGVMAAALRDVLPAQGAPAALTARQRASSWAILKAAQAARLPRHRLTILPRSEPGDAA